MIQKYTFANYTLKTIVINLSLRAGTVLAVLAGGIAQATTLTFDDLPFQTPQTLDGVNLQGVTFDFKVDGKESTDATYGFDVSEGQITYLQGLGIEGDAGGVLTLDFDKPTSKLEFGAALSTFDDIKPGFFVELFDAGLKPLSKDTLDGKALVKYAEALFSYTGVPVKRAVVSFNNNFESKIVVDNVPLPRFGIDNLTFESTKSIPEPASVFGLVLLGIVSASTKKRNQKAQVLQCNPNKSH